ncbi:uncharacterized protein [Cherax quadricarinatus]|uniref:uncharacterized protein n=1 Tax=Cherax quadricarinatus TaxID=27406 RepID=UPI00387E2F9C
MVTLQFRMMDLAILLSCVLPISCQVLNDQTEVGVAGDETEVGVVGAEAEVGVMVSQMVRHHLEDCHLVVLTTTQHSHVFYNILRHLSEGMVAGVVVEAEWVFSLDHHLQGLWGDSRTTCRGLIFDITAKSNATSALQLLESSELWKSPETLVVVVGWKSGVKAVLLHHTFRNSINALYLALHSTTVTRNRNSLRKRVLGQQCESVESSVWIYRRCLYCNNGKADVKLIRKGNFTSVQEADSLFPDQFKNFMGHQFRIVSVQYFPYIDYERNTNLPGTTVTLSDSLDARLLDTFSVSMNFT